MGARNGAKAISYVPGGVSAGCVDGLGSLARRWPRSEARFDFRKICSLIVGLPQEREIPSHQLLAPEQGNHGAERQEGSERDVLAAAEPPECDERKPHH
jgi:hypothetical protein